MVGAATLKDGSTIRFGICPGSSDLIGFRTLKITPEMVGQNLAQFICVEVKTSKGRVTEMQQNFINMVNAAGGKAGVARCVEDAQNLLDS